MSILISGDFHNNARGEIQYLAKDYLIKQYGRDLYKEINYHIILGDGGFLWPGQSAKEIENFAILGNRPFPVLCVMGNHEPVYGRPDLPLVDIGIGEKVILINEKEPFVAYLQRGKVYHIDNHKFLVLGGALSIDKDYRVPHVSWWENEYWSKSEEDALFSLLKNDNDFDYVISHTGPDRINDEVFGPDGYVSITKFHDKVAQMNDEVDRRIKCKQWFCGHFHGFRHHYDEELKRAYQYLYKETALVRETEIIALQDTTWY